MDETKREFIAYIVDDDIDSRDILVSRLRSHGLSVAAFSCAGDFIENHERSRPACLILESKLPDMTGLELQELLNDKQIWLPAIFFTAYGDISSAVRAIQNGAVDFIRKVQGVSGVVAAVERVIHDFESGQGRGTVRHPYAPKHYRPPPRQSAVVAQPLAAIRT